MDSHLRDPRQTTDERKLTITNKQSNNRRYDRQQTNTCDRARETNNRTRRKERATHTGSRWEVRVIAHRPDRSCATSGEWGRARPRLWPRPTAHAELAELPLYALAVGSE